MEVSMLRHWARANGTACKGYGAAGFFCVMSGLGSDKAMTDRMNEASDDEVCGCGPRASGASAPPPLPPPARMTRRLALLSCAPPPVSACQGMGLPGFDQTASVPATPAPSG